MKQLKMIAKQSGHAMIVTEGKRHTKVTIGPVTDLVGRHPDIPEQTAKATIRKLKKELQK